MEKRKQIVCEIIAHQLDKDIDDVSENSRLKEDLWTDSLDALEIKRDLEEKFSITVPDDAWENFETVGDVLKFLDRFVDAS